MSYVKFHTELREDYLREHLSKIKELRGIIDGGELLFSLDEIIEFFDDALIKHEENKDYSYRVTIGL